MYVLRANGCIVGVFSEYFGVPKGNGVGGMYWGKR